MRRSAPRGFCPTKPLRRPKLHFRLTATREVWVPAIWLPEVGNLLLRAQRRKRTALDELAAHHGLSAYDAAYLELALRRGLPWATQDKVLSAALIKAGVAVAAP